MGRKIAIFVIKAIIIGDKIGNIHVPNEIAIEMTNHKQCSVQFIARCCRKTTLRVLHFNTQNLNNLFGASAMCAISTMFSFAPDHPG